MALNNTLIKKHPLLAVTRKAGVWLVLFYLRFFARIALYFFKGHTIGIAGAVGKSTARNALSSILSTYKPTWIVSGNSETGIPLGILNLDIRNYHPWDVLRVLLMAPFAVFHLKTYHYLIVEMGIDGPDPPKNMGYLLTIVKPEIGLLINESPAHVANYERLMGNGSVTERLERVVQYMTHDDGKLLSNPDIKTAIINGDDEHIAQFAKTLPKQLIRTVGKDKLHDISLSFHEISDKGTRFEFALHSFQAKEDIVLTFSNMVLPEETGIAIGAAILSGVALNIPLHTITQNLERFFSLPSGRGSIFKGINDSTIFDSSYNASSASVLSFLNVMKRFKQSTRRPTVFVFGDMKELGSFSAYEHGEVAKELPGSIDHLILVGPLTKELVLPLVTKNEKKFQTLIHVFNSHEAGHYLQTHIPEKAIILFKGSQLLEEAIKYILADKNDQLKLCRQDNFWKTAKKKNNTWKQL